MLKGAERQRHSDACRRRLLTEMKNEPKVKDANKRELEFMAEVVEESQKKKKKKKSESVGEETRPREDPEEASSSTRRGAERRNEDDGKDVEYDEEGTRINEVEKMEFEMGSGLEKQVFEMKVEK